MESTFFTVPNFAPLNAVLHFASHHPSARLFMATPDPRPVTVPPAPDLPDAPPPVTPPLAAPPAPVPARLGTPPPPDDEHLLPVHKGKVGRVTDHVKGAANSLTDWFELRIALLKREVKDEIQTVKSQTTELGKVYGMAAGAGIVALLAAFFMGGFLFVALFSIWLTLSASLFLGWLLYTILFVIAAVVLFKRAEKKKKTLPLFSNDEPAPVTDGRTTPPTP